MWRLSILTIAFLALAAVSLLPASVMAHEEREVGNYVFEIGWAVEPAVSGTPNSLFLKIENMESTEGVAGLEETLQAEVIVGGGAQTKPLPLEASGEEPGVYGSPIVPTRAGDYTFRIFGTIEDQEVDESFSSGPETFDSVEDVSELQFPDKVPSNAELSDQIANLDTVGGDSDTTLFLAIIGIAAGVIGIAVGALAMAQRRA